MAKFRCVCGAMLTTSGEIPHPYEWHLLSDVALEPSFDAEPVTAAELHRMMTFMYRCPESDHLWIFWDGFDHDPTPYAPVDWR